jgi:hypothetical protein
VKNENDSSRLEVSSAGAEEDESNTGRIWAAGFHRIMARSRLARVLKLVNRLFIMFNF